MDVRSDDSLVVCLECGHERSFVHPPLCIVTGAAGTGKTTTRRVLAGTVDAVLLEDDGFAAEACEFDSETAFNEYVLRICRDVAQSKVRPVLFTTGLGVPDNVEGLVDRRYFAESHYFALVCDDGVQADRLRARPGWQGITGPTSTDRSSSTTDSGIMQRKRGSISWMRRANPSTKR